MKSAILELNFKRAISFFPQICLIGLGIGAANSFIHPSLNYFQWILLSMSTCSIIGFILIIIATNKNWLISRFKNKIAIYFFISGAFVLTAVLATEMEQLIRSQLFQKGHFYPLAHPEMYFYNSIIALILGLSFFQHKSFSDKKRLAAETISTEKTVEEQHSFKDTQTTQLPIRQGNNITFIAIKNVVYFEAFDNYSYVYTLQGEKKICDYSLLFLENRLNKSFCRIHRSYIINKDHIKEIQPYVNGRYVIKFSVEKFDTITSSKSYSDVIRGIIKLG